MKSIWRCVMFDIQKITARLASYLFPSHLCCWIFRCLDNKKSKTDCSSNGCTMIACRSIIGKYHY